MRALLLAAATAVVLAAPAAAQPSHPTAQHQAAARTMLETMDMPTALQLSIEAALEAQLGTNPELRQFEEVMRSFFRKYMSWESLAEGYALIYARQFTEQELNEMTAFYRTPTGQKMARSTPQLMQAGAELGQRAVQEHMTELQNALMEAMGSGGAAPKP